MTLRVHSMRYVLWEHHSGLSPAGRVNTEPQGDKTMTVEQLANLQAALEAIGPDVCDLRARMTALANAAPFPVSTERPASPSDKILAISPSKLPTKIVGRPTAAIP